MTTLPPHIRNLLVQEWLGEATVSDQREIVRWLAELPERQRLVDGLRQTWTTESRSDSVRLGEAKRTIHERITSDAMSSRGSVFGDNDLNQRSCTLGAEKFISENRSKRHDPLRLDMRAPRVAMRSSWKVVAALVVCLFVAASTVIFNHSTAPAISVLRYSTLAAHRAELHLADGSHVVLAPQTTIAVIHDKPKHQMFVTVIGEALFTVAHHPGASFIVCAGNATARVLGTTFAVRNYASEASVRVAVVEGRVEISSPPRKSMSVQSARRAILDANMWGMISDSGVVVTPTIAIDDVTAFTSGRLIFQDTPLREVVSALSRAYGVDLRVLDSTLASAPLTTRISTTKQSFDVVLAPVLETLNAHVTRAGRVITIVPGRHARSRLPLTHMSESSYGR